MEIKRSLNFEELSKKILLHLGNFYRRNKNDKNFFYKTLGIATACVLTLFIAYYQLKISLIAYQVEIDGRQLAVVRKEEDFTAAVEKLKEELKLLYGQEAVIGESVKFTKIEAKNKDITSFDEITNNIKKQIDLKVKAMAINVDGETIALVKNKKAAQEILEAIKAPFSNEKDYDSIEFVEKVEVKEVAAEFSDLMSKEQALQLITMGTTEEKIHEVAPGENPWTIARKYDLKMDDIISANPGLDPQKLQIGQNINLVVPTPFISVKTKEYVEVTEEIPFETEYVDTDSLYKGDKKITVQGAEGQRELKAYIIKENGVEVDREILEEKILAEPTTRIIAQGTKERPATVATGTFAKPTRGSLSSPFGARWGRKHEGIDIAAPIGTPVTAADAGKVSYAGRNGSYGNLVIIDHENGYQTYYAHNSKLVVKKGDRVYKGQKIAEVGNTGRSTGAHLHFEVRKNGSPINPQNFVKY